MKFVRRDLVMYTDLPSSYLSRSKKIVTTLAEMITTSGTGWELDSRCQTTESYLDIDCGSSGKYPFLLFRNTNSGCKLYVSCFTINLSSSSVNYNIFPQYNCADCCLFKNSNYKVWCNGIAMSIIPKNSSSEFLSEITSNTDRFPSDATRVVADGMNYSSSSSSTTTSSYIKSNLDMYGNGYTYSLGLLINEETIIYFSSYSSSQQRAELIPYYALGKIFGTLAHTEDTTPQSKYGVFKFSKSDENQTTRSFFTYNNVIGRNIGFYDNSSGYYNNCGCFCNANGSWICNNYTAIGVLQGELLSTNITNSTSADITRWCPFGAASNTSNVSPSSSTYYIVEGDTFKGYLDTDIFRAAKSTKGNYYNNGQFVAVGGNMLLQWDQTATDNIM